MIEFKKKEAIKFGWEITKRNIYFFIIILLLIGGIEASLSYLNNFLAKKNILLGFSLMFLYIILYMIFNLGLIKITLKFYDNEKPKISDVFSQYHLFFKYFWASILYTLISILGYLLLIIPGVIFSIRLWFFGYLIVDKNSGVIESLKKSWEITKGNTWNLFILLILLALINILGFLALVIGLFWAMPTSLLAQAFVYRKLSESLQLKNQEN